MKIAFVSHVLPRNLHGTFLDTTKIMRTEKMQLAQDDRHTLNYDHVIIGGGIAGVSCAKELARITDETITIAIISATEVLKEVKNVVKITQSIADFDVFERHADGFMLDNPRVHIIKGVLAQIIPSTHELLLQDGRRIGYQCCCLCTGARPNLIIDHSHVIGIRDTESVEELSRRLTSSRKVVVLGNGGIALELVHALNWCNVDWVLRSHYIGNTFFDAGASAFIAPSLVKRAQGLEAHPEHQILATSEYYRVRDTRTVHGNTTDSSSPGTIGASSRSGSDVMGGALGPEWVTKTGFHEHPNEQPGQLSMHFGCQIIAIRSRDDLEWIPCSEMPPPLSNVPAVSFDQYPLAVWLSNGEVIECDFLVSATGVVPNMSYADAEFNRGADAGLVVDNHMRTTADPHIFAAGDASSISWPQSKFWFQMRLWSQARTTGLYAAHCMADTVDDDLGEPFEFELFAHVTRFFGFKVVLLGNYNAQNLGNEIEELVTEMVATPVGLVQQDKWKEVAQGKLTPESAHTYMSNNILQDSAVEILTRITPQVEYIKVVVFHNKVVGALLIGDTDLEETFENLILNQLDVSGVKNDLLNPSIDIEDYFD